MNKNLLIIYLTRIISKNKNIRIKNVEFLQLKGIWILHFQRARSLQNFVRVQSSHVVNC